MPVVKLAKLTAQATPDDAIIITLEGKAIKLTIEAAQGFLTDLDDCLTGAIERANAKILAERDGGTVQ